MKPIKNRQKMWLISAILLILTIILTASGCLSSTAEIKLLPQNPIVPFSIPQFFLLKIPNWWNILFFLLFIFISISIIYFLETKNKKIKTTYFPYEEEEENISLKHGFLLGLKTGSVIGLLGILSILINPIITRIITGIIFTSIITLLLIGIYDLGTSLIETNKNRVKNAIGSQAGNVLAVSLITGIASCLRDGLAVGMGIFLTIFLFSIIITLTITTIVIIIKKTRKRIIKFFFYRK